MLSGMYVNYSSIKHGGKEKEKEGNFEACYDVDEP